MLYKMLNKYTPISHLLKDYKLIENRRVTKIVKGGKNISYRTIVIVGDKISHVGLGIGKANILQESINKAILNAHKNLINIPITNNFSIPYTIEAKYKRALIRLYPTTNKTGIITSKTLRAVFDLSGIKNIFAKQIGCKNILNNTKAILLAFIKLNKKLDFIQK